MRISDWSSDVCSSDLSCPISTVTSGITRLSRNGGRRCGKVGACAVSGGPRPGRPPSCPWSAPSAAARTTPRASAREIGRAHVCTPVTDAHLVCCLLPGKKTVLGQLSLYHALQATVKNVSYEPHNPFLHVV